jgi:hypothetical protein
MPCLQQTDFASVESAYLTSEAFCARSIHSFYANNAPVFDDDHVHRHLQPTDLQQPTPNRVRGLTGEVSMGKLDFPDA